MSDETEKLPPAIVDKKEQVMPGNVVRLELANRGFKDGTVTYGIVTGMKGGFFKVLTVFPNADTPSVIYCINDEITKV